MKAPRLNTQGKNQIAGLRAALALPKRPEKDFTLKDFQRTIPSGGLASPSLRRKIGGLKLD